MRWSICGKSDLSKLVDYTLEKEWKQSFFTSRLIENESFVLPSRTSFPVFILKDGKVIRGACMVTSWGSLFPVFSSIDPPGEKLIKDLILRLKYSLKRVYSLMGTEERVNLLRPFLQQYREIPVHYNLMIKREAGCPNIIKPEMNYTLHRASGDDSAALLGLELDYQREEVFLDPSQIDSARIYHNLRGTLENQIVFYILKDRKPVAKAGTNARGYRWNQIGGVFTDKRYRNLGLSTWLIKNLLEDLEKTGKKTVLFVKEKNLVAEKVYTKIGFTKTEKFKIIYYN